MPEIAVRRRRQGEWLVALGGEPLVRQWQKPVAKTVGEQAVAADAHEAPGEHVEEEASQDSMTSDAAEEGEGKGN